MFNSKNTRKGANLGPRRRILRLFLIVLAATLALLLPSTIPYAAESSKSDDPRSPKIREAVDRVLRKYPRRRGDIAFAVASLPDGRVLYSRGGSTPLIPASSQKIITVYTALQTLGIDYRFPTVLYTGQPVRGGKVNGPVYVQGFGDPFLVREELWKIAAEFRVLGIQSVQGDLVIDDSYFDQDRRPPGVPENGSRAYLPRVGAVSFNFNAVRIRIRPTKFGSPAQVMLEPSTNFFRLMNSAVTGKSRSRSSLWADREMRGGRNVIRVGGSIPSGSKEVEFYRNVQDPPQYAGTVLKEMMEREGVQVLGDVRTGRVPSDAHEILRHESRPLGELIRGPGKFSNNFMAEQLLKALGASAAGPPGTTDKGLAVVRAELASLGVPLAQATLADGSGLSRSNRVSPEAMLQVLVANHRDFTSQSDFAGSLPLAAVDGTLEKRFQNSTLATRVRAKTGSLNGISSLCGYLETAAGERRAFAILLNGYSGNSKDLEEEIAEALSR